MIDLLPSRVTRAFGSELAYADALTSVNQFNARFLRGRRIRLRLPFVDSQTHIIQIPTQNHLWKQAKHRLLPARHDQVTAYERPTWRKKRPHPPANAGQPQPTVSTNDPNDPQADGSVTKNGDSQHDDPRVLVRAGDLGR